MLISVLFLGSLLAPMQKQSVICYMYKRENVQIRRLHTGTGTAVSERKTELCPLSISSDSAAQPLSVLLRSDNFSRLGYRSAADRYLLVVGSSEPHLEAFYAMCCDSYLWD